MAYVLPSSAAGGEVGRLRALVAKYFPVYETRVTTNSLVLAVQVDPASMAEKFDELRRELWPMNYVPMLRQQPGETVVEVLRRPQRTTWRPYTNVVMLVITAFTCLFAGAFLWVAYVGGTALNSSSLLWGGLTFALPLMAILGFHELAHFLVARYHHVEASLPFFVPMPPPFVIFGTFGAFISLREPIPDRRTLLDIGASGPIAGFLIAIPITAFGLFLTQHNPIVLPLTNCGPVFFSIPYGNLVIGSSALFYALSLFFPASLVGNMNPLAIAGWVGLLVTAINLLPAGQLDGGHVFRALFGPRAVYVSWAAVVALFILGVFYPGWWIFGFLVLILGARHPPPLNDITPLDWKRRGVGILAVAILLTGFVAVPIASPSGNFHLTRDGLVAVGDTRNVTHAFVNFTLNNDDIVPHAFGFSVTLTVLGASGPSLASWADNLTWTVHLPNGTAIVVKGAQVGENFTLPSSFPLAVPVNNTGQANSPYFVSLEINGPTAVPVYPIPTFTAALKVTEYCQSVQSLSGGGPRSATFTFPS